MANIERKIKFERNGKMVRRTVRAETEEEFIKKSAEIIEKEKQANRITFERAADEWTEYHFKEIAYGTQISYKPSLKRAIEEFGDKELNDISPLEVKRFIDGLALMRYSEKTVKTAKVVVGLVYKFAILKGYTTVNPAEYVTIPRHLKKEIRKPPEDETIQIIKDNLTAPFGLFPYFLLYTGCRRGEALAIRWCDIDFENNVIYIRQKSVFQNNHAIIEDHLKTEAGKRSVPLLHPLRVALESQKRVSPFIFCNEYGEPLTETQYVHRLNKYRKATGAEFTPHQLRHQYATILYEAGIDSGVAQSIMGHTDIRTTQNIYTHIRKNKIEDAAEKLENFIG